MVRLSHIPSNLTWCNLVLLANATLAGFYQIKYKFIGCLHRFAGIMVVQQNGYITSSNSAPEQCLNPEYSNMVCIENLSFGEENGMYSSRYIRMSYSTVHYQKVQCLAKVFGPLELCDLLPHFRLQT
jgi:hypothetical protein